MSVLKQRTIYMGERVPASIVLDDGRLEVRRVNVELLSLQDSDSDSEGSVQVSGTRKRKRLTNLTQEEKLMRRKLKNRMAAQSARDRKKLKMVELEEALALMESENRKLLEENLSLKNSTSHLTRENQILKGKLHTTEPSVGTIDGSTTPLGTTFGGSISHSYSTSVDNQTFVKLESQVGEEEVVMDVCTELGAVHTGSFSESLPESAVLSPQQKEATRTIISLVTAVYLQTTILAAWLVYSWMSTAVKSACVVQVKQEKDSSLHQMMKSFLSTPPTLDPLLPQWWGSHQKSWNPSMNS